MITKTFKTGYNNSNTVHKTDFDTLSEFKNYIANAKNNKVFGYSKQTSQTAGYSFTLTKNYEEALELLNNGWSEGAKDLTAQLNIANAKMQPKEVKRAVYDIVGFQASVPRYIQGIPTNMVNKKTIKQKQKVLNLYKSITYYGGVDAKQIMKDSVKFLQIVQAVEAKGIRVNAYVYFHSVSGGEEIVATVKIKAASEKLNISKMSFPLLHPSMLRRFMFRFMETEPNMQNNSFRDGYGRPQENEKMTENVMGKDCIVIPVLISEKKAMETLERVK